MGSLERRVARDLKEWVTTEYIDSKVEQAREYQFQKNLCWDDGEKIMERKKSKEGVVLN